MCSNVVAMEMCVALNEAVCSFYGYKNTWFQRFVNFLTSSIPPFFVPNQLVLSKMGVIDFLIRNR